MARGRAAGYDDQRDMILAHAALLFANRGYPATSMNQVAEACGYASDSAFSAMFKAAMGQPPSQFGGCLSLTI